MDPRDGLHAPPVAVREPHPVHRLHPADVGRAEAADRNLVLRRQSTRHARSPQELVADRPIDCLVDLGELLHARLGVGVHPSDELRLRFAEVGGDARVLQSRAQRRRMRRGGERAVGPHPQAFLFDAALQRPQHLARQRFQPLAAMRRRDGRGRCECGGHDFALIGGAFYNAAMSSRHAVHASFV